MRKLPLPSGAVLELNEWDDRWQLSLDGAPILQACREGAALRVGEIDRVDPVRALWAACYAALVLKGQRDDMQWLGLEKLPELLFAAQRSGLLWRSDDTWACPRVAFWQLAAPWLCGPIAANYPQVMTLSNGKYHPRRPPKPAGELYRRFDLRLDAWVSLRALDIETDLARFNRWQNNPRVEAFWQEGGDLVQHRCYLEALAADPHTFSIIGCIDDEPFAYFEAYWAKEDRIAPFYDAGNYDRGVHMLVGEEHHRGPHKVKAWLTALVHWLFLDDPRTAQVVAEPRADNARMIQYLQGLGFYREKEFDFPHKRAALMQISRETFFASAL